MNIINLKSVDEKVYHETLENGLEVYVLRKKDFKTCSAQFITKFGGLDLEFVPINEDKMVKFPAGIAHFLEHKLFEQEKGESVSDFFKKSGVSFNATTNEFRTRFYFSGIKNFKENLNFLIDFVQSPYFTDENVLKEKGIIKEEILMCKDNPQRRLYETKMHNLFNEYPFDNTVVGEIEDINRITKEDLYRCYNTFYHPSNMCLVVVSNLDEKEIIKLVRENQEKKDYKKELNIVRKEYNESDNIRKDYEVIYDKVSETRVCYSLKFKKEYFGYSKTKTLMSLFILFDILIGELSEFSLKLKEEEKVIGNIGFSVEYVYDYLIVSFVARPNNEDEYIKLLENQINEKNINKEDFEMIKKSIISSDLFNYNNVESTISSLCNDYMLYGNISNKPIEDEKDLSYEEFMDVVNKFNTKNKSIVVLRQNEKE